MRTQRSRRGISTLAIVIISLLALAAVVGLYFVSIGLREAQETARRNICRDNLRNLAIALNRYEVQNGKYPGYMNVMTRNDGSVLVDPQTKRPTPVSWVVELLPQINHSPLYEQWREGKAEKAYINYVICPSDPATEQTPRLSYVANSGMPDLPKSRPSKLISPQQAAPGFPRDWLANGMFFDNFSDDRFIATNASTRGPMVVNRKSQIRDPKQVTILLTENWDTSTYTFESKDFPDGNPALTEIIWGCNWGVGPIQQNGTSVPTMTPPSTPLAPGAGVESGRHQPDYQYCRPSSAHGDGFNAAFAGENVAYLNNKISYLVYAKLMASDDFGTRLPGSEQSLDPAFGKYLLHESDWNP